MTIRALAVDYDGTLAWHGEVDELTLEALVRAKNAGLKLMMVTGREVHELVHVFPGHVVFDLIVGENGALLYEPKQKSVELLAPKPPERFFAMLQARGVKPISQGRVVVATWEPHQHTVLRTIHDLGLELDIIFNKGAVMVLPSGVNKATGLVAAAKRLRLEPSQVAGAGDAENDHSFAQACGYFAAVANAIPSLKERADWVTPSDHGAGVAELIERIMSGALDGLSPRSAPEPSMDLPPTSGS